MVLSLFDKQQSDEGLSEIVIEIEKREQEKREKAEKGTERETFSSLTLSSLQKREREKGVKREKEKAKKL